jgi:hypothetical protein
VIGGKPGTADRRRASMTRVTLPRIRGPGVASP